MADPSLRGIVQLAFRLPRQNSPEEIHAERIRLGHLTHRDNICHVGVYRNELSVYVMHRSVVLRSNIKPLIDVMVFDLLDNILGDTK